MLRQKVRTQFLHRFVAFYYRASSNGESKTAPQKELFSESIDFIRVFSMLYLTIGNRRDGKPKSLEDRVLGEKPYLLVFDNTWRRNENFHSILIWKG